MAATESSRSLRVEAFAWRPVSLVAAATGLVLFGLSARYGYHRDELYFLASGRHLAWGYPDQPPLVPLLARAMSAIAPGSLLVLRLPSDVAVVGTVLLTAAIARELGAARSGQTLAAVAIAMSNLTLGSGHLLSTTTFGLTVWAAFFAVSLHALRTRNDRWWLLAGVVAGVGLLDNDLVAFLLAATFVGLLLVGPRDVFRSPWLWSGVVVAAVLWSPYLVWQAQHGWPQLQISRSIAAGNSGTSAPRWQIPLQQLFLASPVLDPLWIAGLVRLFRDPRVSWARGFAVAWVVLLLAFVVTGGKPYYLALSFPLLLAAGAQPALDWVRRGRRRLATWTALLVRRGRYQCGRHTADRPDRRAARHPDRRRELRRRRAGRVAHVCPRDCRDRRQRRRRIQCLAGQQLRRGRCPAAIRPEPRRARLRRAERVLAVGTATGKRPGPGGCRGLRP